jgi:hypothetical protein
MGFEREPKSACDRVNSPHATSRTVGLWRGDKKQREMTRRAVFVVSGANDPRYNHALSARSFIPSTNYLEKANAVKFLDESALPRFRLPNFRRSND